VNADGYADIAVGIREFGVYVFPGSSSGVASAASTAAQVTLTGPNDFGSSIALGDVNGDGFVDIAVGADAQSTSLETATTYVFHSGSSAPVPSGTTAGTNVGTLTGSLRMSFGSSVALDDVNGDGFADLLVGEWFKVDPTTGHGGMGAAYVFHSVGTSGIHSGAYTTANTALTGLLNSDLTASYFGWSVALADVNGDGFADEVIAAPFVDGSAGATYIFHSAGAPGVASGTYSAANAVLSGPAPGYLGTSLAVADVNGDGFGDVIAGAYDANGGAGAAYIFQSVGSSGLATRAYSAASTTLCGPSSSSFGLGVANKWLPIDLQREIKTEGVGSPLFRLNAPEDLAEAAVLKRNRPALGPRDRPADGAREGFASLIIPNTV
jgi:hypothetical protein